ncbi:MAG: MATE family efflux transporter, partial [Gemmatimonadales bacterium]
MDREIGALAFPALATLAADPLVSLVDTAFVGRLGTVPLAALGVNAALFSMAFVVFNFLAYGTTPRVARAWGRRDPVAVGTAVAQALTLAVGVGVLATAILLAAAGPLVSLMGATGELRDPALAYLRIRALAGPAVLIMMAGHGIFRGVQDTRTPFRITLLLNLVNLVLDPLLIFGFGWGLEGAAWATLVAQWVGAGAFIWLIFGPRRDLLGPSPHLPSFREVLPFLRVGGELSLRTFALIGTMTLATAVATRVGTAEVAAHQVAVQLWLLLALVVDAVAVAAQALVGRYRGEGNDIALRAMTNRLLVWGLGTGVLLSLLFLAAAPWLPRLFTDDPGTVARVAAILPFVIWMQPLNALVFVWD